ncbi:MAG: hypothetical protein QOF51_1923 [Chloroflexota bacterium]|jgi:hypothetical protein|nr:hypothetical protein [Chloroflexota bacterium]
MTLLLMAVGYTAGGYFFVRLIGGSQWHWFDVGFLPVTAFTWAMGLAAILHWDRFNHSRPAFYAWLGQERSAWSNAARASGLHIA